MCALVNKYSNYILFLFNTLLRRQQLLVLQQEAELIDIMLKIKGL